MGKMRPKVPALTKALTGRFGSHHTVTCARILGHLDFLNDSIAALTEQINQRTATFAPVYTSLLPVPGFDRLSIDVIIAETGTDMSRFPTPGDQPRVGGCPSSHESAGKRRRIGTTRQPVAPARVDRVRPSGSPHQGKLLRRPMPSDRSPSRPEHGRHGRRSLADRAVWHLLGTGKVYEDLHDD